jgi:hypothetical protein
MQGKEEIEQSENLLAKEYKVKLEKLQELHKDAEQAIQKLGKEIQVQLEA